MITKKSRNDFYIDLPKSTVLLALVFGLKVMFFREIPASPFIHIFFGSGLVLSALTQIVGVVRAAHRINLVVLKEVLRKDLEPVGFGDFVRHGLLPLSIISVILGFGLGSFRFLNSLLNSLVLVAYFAAISFVHHSISWTTFYLVSKRIAELGEGSIPFPRPIPSPAVAHSRSVPANQILTECDLELPAKAFKLNYFAIGSLVIPWSGMSIFLLMMLGWLVIQALLDGRRILPLELVWVMVMIFTVGWLSVNMYSTIYSTMKTRFTDEGVCVRDRSRYVMIRWADVRSAYWKGTGLLIEMQDEKVITINIHLYRYPEEVARFVKDMLVSHKRASIDSTA